MGKTTRNIERTLFVEALPEQVFEAFTQADHITRWFAPYALSKPGVGGFISLSWNQQSFAKDCEILEWEPGVHILMTWFAGPQGDVSLPVDVRLEARDGGTVLRLVHSGFLTDASWDDEFDSHGRGWSYELRSLKHYLERQFGCTRTYVMERIPVAGDVGSAWNTLLGFDGLFAPSEPISGEGQTLQLRLPTGQVTVAEVMLSAVNEDFVAVVEVLGNGILRFALESSAGQPELWVWAFSWQLAEKELETLARPWFQSVLERLRV